MSNGKQPKQEVSLVLSSSFASIAAANPQLELSAREITAVNLGNIVIVPPPTFPVLVPKGCITRLYYGDNDEDLSFIEVDGVTYHAENIRDFKEALEKAACCRMCINFCWDKEERRIFMLNLYPCSECRPKESCGCG